MTMKAAVLGHPISHSLSPAIHNAGISHLKLDAEYSAIDVTEDDLATFIHDLSPEWVGLSLTMPLKSRVLELIPSLDSVVEVTGSANTLYRDASGEWQLANTDVYGLEAALKSSGHPITGSAVILGSGATARSAALALAHLGFQHVDVQARSTQAGLDVRNILAARGVSGGCTALEPARFSDYGLVLSTLPPKSVPWKECEVESGASTVLLDVAYSPWPSELAAKWSNDLIVNGIEMLFWQATQQFELFFNTPAPLVAMRGAIQ